MKSNSLRNTFKLLLGLIVTLASLTNANAQQETVYGDNSINLGQQKQYYVLTSASSYQWTIQSDGGQIIGSSTGSTVWVQAIADQTINLRCVMNGGALFGQKNITVSCDTPPTPVVTVNQPNCTTTSGTLIVTSPTEGYEFSFNNGSSFQTSNTITGRPPGTYFVRVKNSLGCISNPRTVTVNAVPSPPATPTLSGVTQPTCSNSKGTFTITNFSGSNNYIITPSSGVTRSGATITAPQGSYTVKATANGCTSSSSVSRTVNSQPSTPGTLNIGSLTQPTCSSANGSFRILNYSSSYTYNFSPSTGVSLQGNLVSAPSGVYSVWATSNVGNCVGPTSTVTINTAPVAPSTPTLSSVTQPTCSNSKGTFTITNYSSSNNYIITPSTGVTRSGATITAPQGSYTVKATDNGCTSSSSSSRTVNTQPTTPGSLNIGTVTHPTCSNPNGSFRILNYNSAYTYNFSPSSGVSLQGNLVSAPTGVYSVSATSGSCTGSIATVTINNAPAAPPAPTLSSVTQPSCSNANGTFTITNYSSSNSYTITPSTGVTRSGATITAPQGSYTVTATDNGCTSGSSPSRTVNNQPTTPPTPTLSPVTQPSCSNATGTFTITNYNSTYTYTFLPSSGVVRNGAIVTAPQGSYTVRATLNGCVSGISQSRTINSQPATPSTPQLSTVTQPTCTTPTGSFTITNYNSAYTYAASPSTEVTISGATVTAPEGNYTITATENGCSSGSSASRIVNGIPSAPATPTLDQVVQPTCAVASGSFKITNYNASYTYAIIPSAGTSRNGDTITATEGSYLVRASVNGCTSVNSISVDINTQPITPTQAPTFVANSLQLANCNNPKASIRIANYNSAFSYSFSPSTGIDPLQGNLVTGVPGVYTIMVTSIDGGCVGPSTTMDISGFDGPQAPTQPTLVLDAQPSCATEDGSFIIQDYNATAFVYEITPSVGLSGPDSNGKVLAPAGNYTVTRRTGNCTSDDSNTISIVAPSNDCPEGCTLTGVFPENPEFLPGADMVLLTFIGDLNCTLQVTQLPSWITYEIVSDTQIRLFSTENTGPERTDVVHILQDGGVLQPLVVSVKQQPGANFAGNPDDPTIVGDGCGDAVLQRIPDAQLPTGETWYWQGNNPIGTSTLLGSGETFTIENFSVDDNYYIRAYKNGNWSAELGVVYVPYKALPEVTSVSVIQPNCELATGTIVINVASNSDSADFTYSFDNGATYQASNTKSGFTQGTYTVLVNNEGCQSSSHTAIVNVPPTGGCGTVNYTGENYVYSRSYQQERTGTPTAFFTEDPTLIQEITYFDGLGRPIQQIGIDQTPSNKDIVTHMEYDDFGRMEKEWLPYAELDAALGTYRSDAKTDTEGHYANIKYGNTANPFSEKLFEPSPLNRIEKQAAPGNVWAMGQDHEIEFDYQGNVASDNVKEYKVVTTPTTTNGVLTYIPSLELRTSNSGNYDTNVLYKTVTYDENHSSGKNHSTEEFTDKQGRVVLKRTYADVTNADGSVSVAEPHDTYYVYDDFGNLTYVLPPKMEGGTAHINELGYQYIYDDRNRLVEKRIPGKDKEYIVYNELDQPIMTQDANQRLNNEWLFTKYDAFGRVAYTGKATDARGRSAVQNDVNLSSDLWVNQGGAQSYGGTTVYYNNGAYPSNTSPVTTLDEILTINYYDNYNFDRIGAPLSTTILGSSPAESSTSNVKGLATGSKVKVLDDMASAAQAWITTVTLYDDKARPVYSYSNNSYLGTVDIVQMQLDFVGRTLKSRTSHTRSGTTIVTIDNFTYDHVGRLLAQTQCIGDETLGENCEGAGGGGATANLTRSGTIDSNLVATNSIIIQPNATIVPTSELRIDPNATGGDGEAELIVLNTYDELGRLDHKKVGGDANTGNVLLSAGLQTVDYNYNVRDWLTGINDQDKYDNDLSIDADDLFAFKIDYENPVAGGTPLYNGNISKTLWRTKSENQSLRSYTYEYDALNRITSGIDNTSDDRYSLSGITYDKNGNILTLSRKGHTSVNASGVVTGYGTMDVLTYSYENNQMSNKLASVTDSGNATYGFKDVSGTTDYDYDVNGNMTSDLNKGITDIEYNHLNLPLTVDIDNAPDVGAISYIYDAAGVKLQKNVLKNGITTPTEYAGNYIYENGQLQFFSQPEGYIELDGSGAYNYIYQYKDHLGNVRLSYGDANGDGNIDVTNDPLTSEIIEENNYYPFGLKHKGYNSVVNSTNVAQDFKYNGVEFEESLGLNLYEMEWRGYDPSLGRFMQVDPQAEVYHDWSPYHFAANNPIFVADPDGQDWIINRTVDEDGNVSYDITINIAVMNSSKEDFDKDEAIQTTKNQIESVLSLHERNDDGTTNTSVTVTANVRSIDSIDELGETEHLLEIVDDWKLKDGEEQADGMAPMDGLRAYITSSSFSDQVNGKGKTIAHEIGHTGGLQHPEDHVRSDKNQRLNQGDDDDNFMYQGTYAIGVLKRSQYSKYRMNRNQAGILYKRFETGKLNKKNNGYNISIFGKRLFSIKRNPGL